jgi:hypothetical protein
MEKSLVFDLNANFRKSRIPNRNIRGLLNPKTVLLAGSSFERSANSKT